MSQSNVRDGKQEQPEQSVQPPSRDRQKKAPSRQQSGQKQGQESHMQNGTEPSRYEPMTDTSMKQEDVIDAEEDPGQNEGRNPQRQGQMHAHKEAHV